MKEFNALRGVARAFADEGKVVDAVVAPRRHHHAAAHRHQRAGCLPGWTNHRQGAAQLSIPSYKGMHGRIAVGVLKSVVRTFDDAEQTARRPAAGIIIHREDFAVIAHQQTEGIPKAARHAAQPRAVRAAVKYPALTTARELDTVLRGQGPIDAVIFAHGKYQPAIGMPRHAVQTVVRISFGGTERSEVFLHVAHAIAVCVLHAQDATALGEIDPAPGTGLHVHRLIRLVVEDLASLPVTVKHQNFIMSRPRITLRAEVRVAGYHIDARLRVHVDTDRRHQIRVLREQGELHPWLRRFDLRRDFRGHHRCRWRSRSA